MCRRRGVRAELIEGWLGGHPSAEVFRAHVDGLLLAAAGDHAAAIRALGAVLDEPEPGLARPLLGSMRTALAVALVATGDRAGARRAVRRALDDDLARWPGVRRDRALGTRPPAGRRLDASRR